MNGNVRKSKQSFIKQSLMTITLCGVIGILSACSSSDDGDGTVVVTPTAFNFNASNAELAGEIAATAMSFFPEATKIAHAVIVGWLRDNTGSLPTDIGLCNINGTSVLSWVDNDSNLFFSDGDTASLQFTSCDVDGSGEIVSGTIDIVATSITLPGSFEYTVAVNLTITSASETTTISANFQATTNSPWGVNYTYSYTADDAVDQTLTITENGAEYLKMGCFSVTQTFDIMVGLDTFDLAPSGAINASNQALSLESGATLSIISDVVESGTQRLLSDSVPNCASIGFQNGAGDSDKSYLDMIMLGGGNVRLRTFDANDTETSSVDTTWDLLTD